MRRFHYLIFVLLFAPLESWSFTNTTIVSRSKKNLDSLANELPNNNNLIDTIANRLSNVGVPYILRDLSKALLTSDRATSVDSWVSTLAGVVALACTQLEMNLDIFFPHMAFDEHVFLNSTSRLLGIGVGMVSTSNDFNDLVRSGQCLNVENGDLSVDGQVCGKNRIGDYMANLVVMGGNVFAIIFPSIGPYVALTQFARTVVAWVQNLEAESGEGREKSMFLRSIKFS